MALTWNQLEQVAAELDGTCQELHTLLAKLGIVADPEAVEDQLLSVNMERCRGCGWWMDSCELVGDDIDSVTGYCDQCRPAAERACMGFGGDVDEDWD